jgi:hypothetical protein
MRTKTDPRLAEKEQGERQGHQVAQNHHLQDRVAAAQPLHRDALGGDDQHRQEEKADALNVGTGFRHAYVLPEAGHAEM